MHAPLPPGPSRTIAALALVLAIILALAAPALAFSQLETTVEVIRASRAGNDVDPRLSGLADELPPGLYSSLSLEKLDKAVLSPGQEARTTLEGGRTLVLKFENFSQPHARIMLHVVKDGQEIFSTRINLANNGYVIIADSQTREGATLVRIGGVFLE